MYAKALRENLDRISADMHAILNVAKADKNRGLTSEEREKWAALGTEYDNIEASIKIAEKTASITDSLRRDPVTGALKIDETSIDAAVAEFHLSPAEKRRKDNAKNPHALAFSNYLRHGDRVAPEDLQVLSGVNNAAGMKLDIRNVTSTTVPSQGAVLIPQGFSNMLEEAKKWFGGIEGTVEKFQTGTGNPLPWPTLNDTTNRGRILGQNVQVAQTDPVFNQVTFNAYIGSSDLVLIPVALIEDSYFDLDALVAKLLGTRLGRLFNWKCTVGTGVGEPTGIVNASVAAGNILQLSAGNTASVAYGSLVDLEHSVDPAYRENPTSRWMFSDTMLKLIKKLVDGNNRPLWQPGLSASFQMGAAVMTGSKPKILEHEYVINQDMAAPAANAYSALFGDLSSFKVREVAGGTTVLVLRERYADYWQVGYIAFQRVDSQLVDAGTHPIAVLQQSAA